MTTERSLTRGSLERFCGTAPTDQAKLIGWAARAHHENRGVAVIFLDRVRNPARLAAIQTELDVQYGKPIPATKDVTHGSR